MSVEVLKSLSVGFFLLALVFFVTAFVMLAVFRIPAIIGDLSGFTERRAIEQLRKQNMAGNKRDESAGISGDRSKMTGQVTLLEKERRHTVDLGYRGKVLQEIDLRVEYEIEFCESSDVIEL